jgi:molybdopterin converting factor small subunit
MSDTHPQTLTILYTAQARARPGTDSEQCAIRQGDTIADVLERAIARHAGDLRSLLLDPCGKPRPTTLLFVNGRQAAWDAPEPARAGDEIVVLTPMSGG